MGFNQANIVEFTQSLDRIRQKVVGLGLLRVEHIAVSKLSTGEFCERGIFKVDS